MTDVDNQRLLDGLDRRLALGEIDLATYKMLREKFTKGQASEPLGEMVSKLPQEVERVHCPNCGAPIDRMDRDTTSVKCEYCGVDYVLRTAEEEMERLRSDLRRWISEVSGSSKVVDEASRKFIFNEKVYPRIELEVRRTIEPFELVAHGPLLNLPVSRVASNSAFLTSYRALPPFEDHRLRLTEVLNSVQSAELQQYAVSPADRSRLRTIEIKCREAVHLQNVRKLLFEFHDGTPKLVMKNISALMELYDKSAQELKEGNPIDHAFYMALNRRMKATYDLMGILDKLMGKDGPGDLVGNMDALKEAVSDLEGTIKELEGSGKDLREVVPAVEGIRADIDAVRVLVHTYEMFQSGPGLGPDDFMAFVGDVESLVREQSSRGQDLNLTEFMGMLNRHISAVHLGGKVNVSTDFSWEGGVVQANIKSSFFGGTETARVKDRFLVPFWVSMLFFSKQKGLIFKNGYPDQGCLLVPAFDNRAPVLKIENESRIFAQVQGSMDRPSRLGKDLVSLCPSVDGEMALKKMRRYQATVPQLGGSYIRMMGLVYLPGSLVSFARKGERTALLFADSKISCDGIGISERKVGTYSVNICS